MKSHIQYGDGNNSMHTHIHTHTPSNYVLSVSLMLWSEENGLKLHIVPLKIYSFVYTSVIQFKTIQPQRSKGKWLF